MTAADLVVSAVVLALVAACLVGAVIALRALFDTATGTLSRVPVRYMPLIHLVAILAWVATVGLSAPGLVVFLVRTVSATTAIAVVHVLAARGTVADLSQPREGT